MESSALISEGVLMPMRNPFICNAEPVSGHKVRLLWRTGKDATANQSIGGFTGRARERNHALNSDSALSRLHFP
jgi:hypothetical protein